MSKIDSSLFSAPDQAFGACPQCGNALRIRNSKTGPFIGCSAYPECTYSKPLQDNQTTVLKEIEGTQCPLCQHAMAIKKGRFGMFIGCTNFPDCQHIEPIKTQEDTHLACPKCQTGSMIERTNKFGKRFFACDNYPTCRYVVNFQPVAGQCPQCGWQLLINKKGKVGCPQPLCDFVQESAD
ncbi:DNA topoisomerase family protein [Salinimonas sediminis]|uniref:DNA topoisomerase type IA zn finger domain-containing protein n=1 Tax=Salinimonas sediminis TaxID=2303538 RepID=A0A346NRZ4_9ALTE|nr:topoisomerase DNA-binding C4 zinc finger domain-containing protein [Salinimonas sediminis]AXR08301.1 hypothetical protein D0Y50_19270 [Salinimonas sediminis]